MTESPWPTASIVIVNYNGLRLLEPCLSATLDQARAAGAEVILVDNASSDGSVTFVREAFPDVRIVQSSVNEGFAGGCNAGVRQASGALIVLLNNDAVPRPGWLGNLLAAVQPADVAVACSVINDLNYPDAYALGTGSISVVGHPIPNVAKRADAPFYATGCSLVFKGELFGEPFDPLFFAYFEDTVLSWRAHLRGYRVARALDSVVDHLGSATASQQPGRFLYYWDRNRLLMLLLCYERATLARLMPLYVFDSLARLAQDISALAKARGTSPPKFSTTLRRYLIAGRALGWLATHPEQIARLRQSIQQERCIPDREVTPMLSGKIFDDLRPTTFQRLANLVSVSYCRLVGIETAEQVRDPVR